MWTEFTRGPRILQGPLTKKLEVLGTCDFPTWIFIATCAVVIGMEAKQELNYYSTLSFEQKKEAIIAPVLSQARGFANSLTKREKSFIYLNFKDTGLFPCRYFEVVDKKTPETTKEANENEKELRLKRRRIFSWVYKYVYSPDKVMRKNVKGQVQKPPSDLYVCY